jgi:uncharacterized protein YlxW (UPF0749 family)
MSFGFGVSDFVLVASLTIALHKAFKNAPKEFVEISHQLQSLNMVIAETQRTGRGITIAFEPEWSETSA